MDKSLLSVVEVAQLLGLHVKTVRRYVREGRIASARVGKQYRIPRQSLEAFTGMPLEGTSGVPVQTIGVSSVVQLDGIGRARADRLTNMLVAASRRRDEQERLRVDCIYDEEASTLKVIVIGSIRSTAILLEVIENLARN